MINNRALVWLQAARLPSQSYIFIPLLLGQSVYFFHHHEINFTVFLLVQLFGILDQLYIVFANDYADLDADKANKTYTIFSGGSRVLVEGKITPSALKKAAILMAISGILLSVLMTFLTAQYLLIPLSMIAIFLLYAYSYKPFQLSYRGGGEFLQMLGVGLVLPLFGFIAQSGKLTDFPLELLPILLLINLSCAMATSLPDAPSDKIVNKKTIAVVFGENTAKKIIITLKMLAFFLFFVFVGIQRMSLPAAALFFLPLVCILISYLGFKAQAGSLKLSVFVFFSIAFNLFIQSLLVVKFFHLLP
jgi:1,4-dihydroxy-2-naphthoate octaprenyltransferase